MGQRKQKAARRAVAEMMRQHPFLADRLDEIKRQTHDRNVVGAEGGRLVNAFGTVVTGTAQLRRARKAMERTK